MRIAGPAKLCGVIRRNVVRWNETYVLEVAPWHVLQALKRLNDTVLHPHGFVDSDSPGPEYENVGSSIGSKGYTVGGEYTGGARMSLKTYYRRPRNMSPASTLRLHTDFGQ